MPVVADPDPEMDALLTPGGADHRVISLCEMMESGMTYRASCKSLKISTSTMWKLIHADNRASDRYNRAREVSAHRMAEQVVDISDEPMTTQVEVSRARLRTDNRRWLAGKLAPQHYGDRQMIEHTGTVHHILTADERARRLEQIIEKRAKAREIREA